jgi:hypothetical protein
MVMSAPETLSLLEDQLEPFFAQVGAVNPFLENRVNGPAPPGLDVPDVHRKAFEQLTGLAGQALAARKGVGAVLWSEAGIGKSHLLARLGRWAGETGAPFVYVHNLQAAPDALPRSLLHAIVRQLTGGRRSGFAGSPLYHLVRAGLVEAVGGPGRYDPPVLEHHYHRWLNRLGPAAGDRLVWEVLFAFFLSAHQAGQGKEDGSVAGVAVRWLSGGALDPVEGRLLGLPPGRRRDDPLALEDAQQIKQVLVALSHLAVSQGRPFVLALDQVDNLDSEQFAALARFLEALLDTAANLLVITTGIQTTLLDWKQAGVVQSSAWDRIAQIEVRLQKLTPGQAVKLVRSRLDHFLAPFASLDAVAQAYRDDPLFPLGRAWAERNLNNLSEIRARDTISAAREGWRQEQVRLHHGGGRHWLAGWPDSGAVPPVSWDRQAAIDQTVADEIQLVRNRLHAEPGSLSVDADHLAGTLHDVLQRYGAAGENDVQVQRVPPPRRNVPPTYHLSLRRRREGHEAVTGVLVLATGAAVGVAGFLRRLLQDSKPLDRLVLVTLERVGLPLGEKGQEYLEQLRTRGRDHLVAIELTFAEHAELEALSVVLGRAKSCDVEIEPPGGPVEALSPDEVAAAPAWRTRVASHRLLRELLAVPAVTTTPAPAPSG